MSICVYISRACPKNIYAILEKKSSFAAYKFNRLLIEGFANNGVECHNLLVCDDYFSNKEIQIDDSMDKINYYLTGNINVVKKFSLIFFQTLKCLKKNKNSFIFCDYLNYVNTLACLAAAIVLKRKRICVVTDLPEYIGDYTLKTNHSFKEKLFVKVGYFILHRFNEYVFLTEQMAEKFPDKKYIVVEGLVDTVDILEETTCLAKEKTIMYAGSLNKEYGLQILISGFIKSDYANDYELHIYGSGTDEEVNDINKYCTDHSNVKFGGMVDNDIILHEEQKATLLVNPRFSTFDYCKYSFPSKNMEYMSSGTPLLTTLLPGIPLEYYDKIYILKEESDIGIANKLNEILSKNEQELFAFGNKARKFILLNKNKYIQCKRILEFIYNSEKKGL